MMKTSKLMVAGLVLSVAGGVFAEDPGLAGELEQLKQQLRQQQQRMSQQDQRIQQQQAELQQMRAAQGETWLTERRAEEVKTLIKDVLSDADTRASLAEGGMTAGWKDHFFLASEDGNFLMRFSGQVQSRYTYNSSRERLIANEDEDLDFDGTSLSIDDVDNIGDGSTGGFEMRRAKIRFDGHLFDPKFTYAVQINTTPGSNPDLFMEEVDADDTTPDREFQTDLPDVGRGYGDRGGVMYLEDAWAAYEFADGWQVQVGQFKGPFMREEAVHSGHLVAVERSLVNDLFTIDYTQGIGLNYSGELVGTPMRAMAMIHDGSYQANTGFNGDTTDFAIAGRTEFLLAGEWSQFDDQQAWSGGPMGILLGAAVDYEVGERGRNSRTFPFVDDVDDQIAFENANVLKWTVDASVEVPDMYGLSLFGAIVGQHINRNGEALIVDGADQYAYMLQASAFVVPDKMDVFVRWEHLELNGLAYVPTTSHGPIDYAIIDPLDSKIDVLTFGSNYYFRSNAAKASLDVVWALDPLPFNASNQGLHADARNDQFALRAQFQFLF